MPLLEWNATRRRRHMRPRLVKGVSHPCATLHPSPSTYDQHTHLTHARARLLHSKLRVRQLRTRVRLVRRASRRITANLNTLSKSRSCRQKEAVVPKCTTASLQDSPIGSQR